MPQLTFTLLFFLQILYTQSLSNMPNPPLKILCLGDSITEGPQELGFYNYRYELWKKLVDLELEFDFLGTVIESRKYKPYKEKTFDPHNQGHSGWTSAEVNEQMDVWLKQYNPDVVLLHLGTNDFRKEKGHEVFVQVGKALFEMKEIIEKFQTANPDVVIYLAKIIPHRSDFHPIYEEYTQTFNEAIASYENVTYNLKGSVIIVDQYTDFKDDYFLKDGTHPNEKGVAKMADTWYDALLPFVNKKKPKRIHLIIKKEDLEKEDTAK